MLEWVLLSVEAALFRVIREQGPRWIMTPGAFISPEITAHREARALSNPSKSKLGLRRDIWVSPYYSLYTTLRSRHDSTRRIKRKKTPSSSISPSNQNLS